MGREDEVQERRRRSGGLGEESGTVLMQHDTTQMLCWSSSSELRPASFLHGLEKYFQRVHRFA